MLQILEEWGFRDDTDVVVVNDSYVDAKYMVNNDR